MTSSRCHQDTGMTTEVGNVGDDQYDQGSAGDAPRWPDRQEPAERGPGVAAGADPGGAGPACDGTMNREERMDTTMATTRLEGAIQQQVIVAGGDPEVEAAARAILSAP